MATANQRKKGTLKADLLKAAEKRINEGGIGALSLRKLAQDTGVTTMATYHHFANKEALLIQIAINGFDQLSDMMLADCAEQSTPAKNITAIMRGYFKFALENPYVYHLMFGQEIQAKPSIPEFKKAASDSFYLMANTVKKHLDESGHNVDADAVGMSFWGTLHGLASLVTDGTIFYNSRSDEKLESLIDMAVKGLFYIY